MNPVTSVGRNLQLGDELIRYMPVKSAKTKKYDEKTMQAKTVAEEVARKIGGLSIGLHKKAGEGDVLYGSVTPAEIADALLARGIEVDRRRIELAEPIKRLGAHTVHVRLHRDVVSELTIDVQPIAAVTQ